MDARHHLAIDAALLRVACAACGIGADDAIARAHAGRIAALIARGDLVARSTPLGRGRRGRRATSAHATDEGRERLIGLLERHGLDFGPRTALSDPHAARHRDHRDRMCRGREPRPSRHAALAAEAARARASMLDATDAELAIRVAA